MSRTKKTYVKINWCPFSNRTVKRDQVVQLYWDNEYKAIAIIKSRLKRDMNAPYYIMSDFDIMWGHGGTVVVDHLTLGEATTFRATYFPYAALAFNADVIEEIAEPLVLLDDTMGHRGTCPYGRLYQTRLQAQPLPRDVDPRSPQFDISLVWSHDEIKAWIKTTARYQEIDWYRRWADRYIEEEDEKIRQKQREG